MVQHKNNNLNELYERLVDLAILVSDGKVDPLDIDISRFLNIIKEVNLEKYDTSMLYKDIRALNGLILILEAQYKALKDKGLGLYIEPLLVRLKAKQLSIEKLANILLRCWTPTINVITSSTMDLLSSFAYFKSLKPLSERKLIIKPISLAKEDIKAMIMIPENIELKLKNLYKELVEYSEGSWVEYISFIYKSGDPIERAYLMSFLVTMGAVQMKYKRLEDKYFIKPVKAEAEVLDVYSIPVNIWGVNIENRRE